MGMMGQGGQMDPMMLMLLGDDNSDMKDMLPLMMMQQGAGAEGAAPMDPMMLMLMSDDSSDMKDLLPLMMMNGGQQMDPMMMMIFWMKEILIKSKRKKLSKK